MTTQFDRIFHGLSTDVGKFRVAASGMAWKAEERGDSIALSSAEIKWVQWLRVARGFQLRVGLKDRRKETFDGFEREDHDKLASILKQHFGVILESQEVSFKGWNWGITDFRGDDLAFLVSNKTSFELPLQNVANSNIAGRTEVSLEFLNPSGADQRPAKGAPDEMVEIRFFVPGTSTRVHASDAGSQKSDAEDDGEEISAAQAFHDSIKEKAELGQVTGNMILSFEEVLVLTPRGRYDVDMFPDFLRLRGKTYDYKIAYSSISRLFLLPKDDLHVLFILYLNNPIRQGQTKYQYLVMQFSREEETTAELNMEDSDHAKISNRDEIAKYDRLNKKYDDPTFEVVSSVFRALSKKKIISAGKFSSRNGHPGLKANLKAVQGDLYMLDKFIFFVSKQPVLIEFSDIHQIIFSRLGTAMGAAAARTFDMKVVTQSGPEYTFTSINKEEYDRTDAFLKEKKIRVKSDMLTDQDILAGADDSDEEMQSVASDDDEEPHVKRTGDDDDDSEEDEDFQASSSDEGSPSDSDSDDEGGATASDASGDREFTKPKKTKEKGKAPAKEGAKKKADTNGDKPKKATKPAPKKDDDDDVMDIDEPPKPKPKPKPRPVAKSKAKEDGEDGPARKKLKKSED
ncbi:SSrecog-domain-containing protein [Dentipellis sp. KUC8613]|nr:SSrecog-domain-containing protein [Dentipellis sp. KUC8613]